MPRLSKKGETDQDDQTRTLVCRASKSVAKTTAVARRSRHVRHISPICHTKWCTLSPAVWMCGLPRPWHYLNNAVCSTAAEQIAPNWQRSAITDRVLFPDNRCVTLTRDGFLTVWDLRLPPEKSCVATLADIAQTVVKIHRLSGGRFVCIHLRGDVCVYYLNNPVKVDCIRLGNTFCCQTEGYRVLGKYREYRPEIRWMVGMGDGRLLAVCEIKKTTKPQRSAKTRFCVYDPYSRSAKPDGAIGKKQEKVEEQTDVEEED